MPLQRLTDDPRRESFCAACALRRSSYTGARSWLVLYKRGADAAADMSHENVFVRSRDDRKQERRVCMELIVDC